jgi:hypothetical protein
MNKQKKRKLKELISGLNYILFFTLLFFIVFEITISFNLIPSLKNMLSSKDNLQSPYDKMNSLSSVESLTALSEENKDTESSEDNELVNENNEYIDYNDIEDSTINGRSAESGEEDKENFKRNIPPEEFDIIFASGRGLRDYDKMSYMDYESEFYFTPYFDMKINTIEPEIYSCLEECYLIVEIYDEFGNKLVEGFNKGKKKQDFTGTLFEDIILRNGNKYRIHQHIWSTRLVGIYTSGKGDKRKNNGEYEVIYAKSKYYVDYKNRGPISFKIRGTLKDSRFYESASWECKRTSVDRYGEITLYNFNDFKKHDECKKEDEWLVLADELCTSLCKENDNLCKFSVKNLKVGEECAGP